ncbi:hypothetical protein PHMEG_00026611, partial [Phytophthora megakarya]
YETIFKDGDGDDAYHSQMTVPPSEELTRVEENVLKIVQHVNSDWVIRAGSWKFLVSEKGGTQQQVHRDFLDRELAGLDASEKPDIVMIVIEHGTKLATYGWNILEPEKDARKAVQIPRLSLFIGREDLVHAGMAYATRNVSMHCCLDVFGKVYLPNHTQLYLWTEHLCSNCYKVLDSARVRNGHQAACTVYMCRPCEKCFGTKEGLKSHRARKHKYLKL